MGVDINIIAKECGVSKTTVSKVFTQKPGISQAMRQKVLEVARRLNYTPRQVAAQDTIAILVDSLSPDETHSLRAQMLALLLNRLAGSRYLLRVVACKDVELAIQGHVKLVIGICFEQDATRAIALFQSSGIPVLLINNEHPGCFSVRCDHAQGVELAVAHLADCGHQRIALLLDSGRGWGGRERRRGYEAALQRLGLPLLPVVCLNGRETTMVECLHQIWQQLATAVIICGEGIIDEAVYMLHVLGLSVPGELSVISSEIPHRSRWLIPPHTTMQHDIEAIVEQVRTMTEAILKDNQLQPCVDQLPSKLIFRDSVRDLTIERSNSSEGRSSQ